MGPELWLRPWALLSGGQHRIPIGGSTCGPPQGHRAALWRYSPQTGLRPGVRGQPVEGFDQPGGRALLALALPLRRHPGDPVGATGDQPVRLDWPDLPDRPAPGHDPATEAEQRAHALLQRATSVWERLADVDTALADPVRLWNGLHLKWMRAEPAPPPRMHPIADQAREMAATLDALERAPRRVLRRAHRLIPIARVQEIDRRAMLFLVRQPGETMAERAGDRQRVLAVAREESFDTLENRVLRAYAELAWREARDYCERHRAGSDTSRWRRVDAYGRRCRRLARDLAGRGVREAEPGVIPNHVLLENPRYHAVWAAWQDLLRRLARIDEVWRWQARSWEEFGALAIMVALIEGGARPVATSPLVFRDEQQAGSWIAHDNPFAVFHLPDKGMVVEVGYRMREPGSLRADFAAPIWISIGRTDDAAGFPYRIAVWPLWDIEGGLVPGEAAEVREFLPRKLGTETVAAAILIRPTHRPDEAADAVETGPVLAVTLGTEGAPLREGLLWLRAFLGSRFGRTL